MIKRFNKQCDADGILEARSAWFVPFPINTTWDVPEWLPFGVVQAGVDLLRHIRLAARHIETSSKAPSQGK
jgi:hypothetical protein